MPNEIPAFVYLNHHSYLNKKISIQIMVTAFLENVAHAWETILDRNITELQTEYRSENANSSEILHYMTFKYITLH